MSSSSILICNSFFFELKGVVDQQKINLQLFFIIISGKKKKAKRNVVPASKMKGFSAFCCRLISILNIYGFESLAEQKAN